MNSASEGTLYILSTPIGNLKDITHRALEILSSVHLILAEDTRQTSKLLHHYQIRTPSESFHDYSSAKKIDSILARLREGKSFALVSDSGTPLLSDPGYPLVRDVIKSGFPVIPIPGPSAFLAALVASGAPMDRFIFHGFLPPKGTPRRERLDRIREDEITQILYESPYHLMKLLGDLKTVLGETRKIIIAREITKIHEEFLRETVLEMEKHFEKIKPLGEFVVIIPKRDKTEKVEETESPSEI